MIRTERSVIRRMCGVLCGPIKAHKYLSGEGEHGQQCVEVAGGGEEE